ncbi:MAG: PstS family phosphate ABC transporter substrate-binding protein [Nitriliruptoraceae bacterium]
MQKFSRSVAAAAAIALLLAACGGTDDATEPVPTNDSSAEEELTGSVNVDGSSTVGPFSEVAAELFMEDFPGVRVTVAISGTGGGFEKFCKGETDASNASRLIKESEEELCKTNGIKYDYVQVANDALSVVVNNENPIACMTPAQVQQIWDAGSTVTVWGDIDGLDLPAEWVNEPVILYGPGSDSGTFDYFTEEINGEKGKIRNDYTDIGEDDTAAVVGVSGTRGGIGYIPFSYYQEATDQVKGLPIDDGNGCIDPTPENVGNLTYTPLGRGLFTYFSDVALKKPETIAFATHMVTNAQEIANLSDYVPMSDEQIAEQLAKIDTLAGN